MADWITVIVVVIVVFFGLFAMYKAMKEPIDALGRLLGGLFRSIGNSLQDKSPGQVISYD